MAWIRNEWVYRGSSWTQDREEMCLIGTPTTWPSIREVIALWHSHQRFETDGLILGIPHPEELNKTYLIVFHKEVRRAR